MKNFSIGADPEYFLRRNGEYVSAFGLIEGDKRNPKKLHGGAVQVDGTALEFNIDPVTNNADWHGNIESVLEQIREIIPPEYEFRFDATANFDPEYFSNLPEESKMLGCDPDFNAYTGRENVIGDGAADRPFRTGAGHIHFGWGEGLDTKSPEHHYDCRTVALFGDAYIGLPLAILEGPTERSKLYGAPGAYRPKPYGCEYRSPSNWWVKDPATRDFVWRQAKFMQSALKKAIEHRGRKEEPFSPNIICSWYDHANRGGLTGAMRRSVFFNFVEEGNRGVFVKYAKA